MWKTKTNRAPSERNYFLPQYQNKQRSLKKTVRNIVLLIAVMALCTGLSVLFRHWGGFESNIVMVYLLGIFLFSYLASDYAFSIIASFCGVLLYNYFFTEPLYTLRVYSPDYLITFLIMFIVGFFTSMLTIRIKWQTEVAEEREGRIKALYYVGRKLLEVKSVPYLAEICAQELKNQYAADVLVELFDATGAVLNRHVEGADVFDDDKERIACFEAYQTATPCGRGTKLFSQSRAYYLPIIGQNEVLGVIGISLDESAVLTDIQSEFLDAIAPQIAVVLEREKLYQKQAQIKMQVQSERLRADMLRTISHDLRTPLTGIMGSASTMLDNYDTINDEIKKSFLHNIYDDAGWLNELVENILNMTRFEEGRVKLNIGKEAAEEIIAQAISHVEKRASGHTILTKMPPEIVLLNVDGVLITQVLVNLLGNAVNYTPGGSEITVSVTKEKGRVAFAVSDNGPGVMEADIPHLFEQFYTRQDKAYSARKGMGLGLSLCKSIVEAHGGEISIKNNEPHGTTVRFTIPLKGATDNAAADSNR